MQFCSKSIALSWSYSKHRRCLPRSCKDWGNQKYTCTKVCKRDKEPIRPFFYRRYIKDYAHISQPLNELLKTENVPNFDKNSKVHNSKILNANFKWTKECQIAFEKLKDALCSSDCLAFPDLSRPFKITCDASTKSIGYILSQKDEKSGGKDRPLAFGGRCLRGAELRYCVSDLECLALVEAIKAYHNLIAHQLVEIESDHLSLKYLNNLKLNNGRLFRWSLALSGYKVLQGHIQARGSQ